jgi:hypothetical protein
MRSVEDSARIRSIPQDVVQRHLNSLCAALAIVRDYLDTLGDMSGSTEVPRPCRRATKMGERKSVRGLAKL